MSAFAETKSYYESLTLKQKFDFFDDDASDFFQKLDKDILRKFLHAIILDNHENSYLRRRAIEIHTQYVLLQKLKPRHVISILIDNWEPSQELFIEVRRLQDLFLFYEEEPEEINATYQDATVSDEAEIQAEALFHLGLITLFEALNKSKDESLVLFEKSYQYFRRSHLTIENRVDAEFFEHVVAILLGVLKEQSHQVTQKHLKQIAHILRMRKVFSLSEEISIFELRFYKNLVALSEVRNSSPHNWLDFRQELIKLHANFSQIKNEELKSQLFKNSMHSDVANYLKNHLIEPYFAISLSAEQSRIKARLQEDHISPEHKIFLEYLLDLTNKSDFKKKSQQESLITKLRQLFPNNPQAIQVELNKISDFDDTHQIINVIENLSSTILTIDMFCEDLYQACVKLQKSKIYHQSSEDERNDFIGDLLETGGYLVKDQTRRGLSSTEISSGEIDIFISEATGVPFTIIEALNLKSVDKNNINTHVYKVFNYDTVGNKNNFILVYSNAKKFGDFWKNYTAYIPNAHYPYDLIHFETIELFPFTDIKLGKSTHSRNSTEVYLYHMAVNMEYGR